jgi:hypothetical protein
MGGHAEAVRLLLECGANAGGESGAPALRAATSDDVKALLREHGATLTLLEECRDGNAAAIAQLLDGGAVVGAVAEERRPTVGDVVLIVGGQGKGSVATITRDDHDRMPYMLQSASCGSKQVQGGGAGVTEGDGAHGSGVLWARGGGAAAARARRHGRRRERGGGAHRSLCFVHRRACQAVY